MAWLNLPNLLTLTRIAGSFLFLSLMLHENWPWALLVFSLAALTDMIDGALARLLHQRTRLGGFLDPTADKFLMFCGFFVLTWKGIIPLWVTGIVVARDLMITVGIFYFLARKVTFAFRPTYLSKATTLLQIMTLLGYLCDLYRQAPLMIVSYVLPDWLFYLTVATGAITVTTGIQYIRIGWRILHEARIR